MVTLRSRRLHGLVALIFTSAFVYIQREIIPLPHAITRAAGGSTRCSTLPSTDSRFQLELCSPSDGCNQGSITVTAPIEDCSVERAVPTSNDTAQDAWTYEHLGPHTFHLQLYGAVRAAQEPGEFLGSDKCSWRFDFDARASGRLGFQVHHVYEEYMGYMNVYGPPPLSQWTALIPTPPGHPAPVSASHGEKIYVPEINLCPEPSLVNKHILGITQPPAVARPLLKYWRTKEQNEAKQNAPLCSRHDPVSGVYRPLHPSDARKSLASYRGYVWEPEPDCRMDELPYLDTAHRDVEAHLNLHERSILFLGDSHNRYAYYFLRSWYQQNWTYLLDPYRLKDEHPSWKRGKTQFEHVFDRFLDSTLPQTMDCDRFTKVYGAHDTVVLTTGHHLMIKNHGETNEFPDMFISEDAFVERVRQTVDTFVNRCPPQEGAGFKTRRIVWMSPPAHRPPWTKFRWDDHRTNTRLWRYNSQATEMLRRDYPSVAIIDQFALTLPFIREMIDGLHTFGTDAAYPIALELSHKIGIGKPRDWWAEASPVQRDESQHTYALSLAESGTR